MVSGHGPTVRRTNGISPTVHRDAKACGRSTVQQALQVRFPGRPYRTVDSSVAVLLRMADRDMRPPSETTPLAQYPVGPGSLCKFFQPDK
jgi:hypothetical protein